MKKIISLTLFALVFFDCSIPKKARLEPQNSELATSVQPDENLIGNILYINYCSVCHGFDGGVTEAGSAILKISTLTLADRIKVITKGRNLMTPFEELLSEEKIKAVAEYLEVLRK